MAYYGKPLSHRKPALIIASDRSTWASTIDLPLELRHAPAPPELLRHLDQVNGAPQRCAPARTASPGQDLLDDVSAALRELPEIVRARLRENWLGVYFAHDVGSSAATDIVVGPEGEFLGIAVVLDIDAVGRGANEWATWRENLPFAPGPFHVTVRIADSADDNRKNAIQFLLLHEIGHVLAAGRGFVPDWWLTPDQVGQTGDYSFLPLSWRITPDGKVVPLPENDFPQRAQLNYYGAAQLPSDQLAPAYHALLASGFFTLYSAQSADEDFSEAFALYVHIELLQKPYIVRIHEGPRMLLQYATDWEQPRFADKRLLLQRFLPRAGDDIAPLPDYAGAAAVPYAPLIGVAPLMLRAFRHEDLAPLAQVLVARAQAHPLDASAYLDCSTVLQLTGDHDVALAVQAEAVRIQPRYTLPARRGTAPLRLLVLMGLGDLMSNTPIEFLVEDSDVTLELLYLTQDAPWPEQFPEHDVMMVALAESETNQPLLQRLSATLAGWPRPILNRPERIAVLSRDGACAALAGIAGVEMPRTARVSRAQLAALVQAPDTLAGLLPDAAFPLIVRPIGSHAGHDLEKIDNPSDLPAYLERVGAERFYLARFVDYRGSDGMFRKFRVVLIGGRPLVCHYAISQHWMIHYLNAGMDQSADKRAEEALCMRDFDATFALKHRDALAEIDRRIGLPYLGIDCAEMPDGRLLIFEIDNAMVVHAMDDEQMYPYKKPAMRKVFDAFRQLLEQLRGSSWS